MSLLGGLALYALIWIVVLFTVLPLRLRGEDRRASVGDPGAPDRPRLLMKFLTTSAISAALLVLLIAIDINDLINRMIGD